MLKKTLLIVVALAFMCAPALAGERPEFDVVGCDSDLFFSTVATDLVLANNPWNACPDSDFTDKLLSEDYGYMEFFDAPGAFQDSVCFPGYQSKLLPAGSSNGPTFTWRIVLQMKPDTDLDINIIDCVLKPNELTTPFGNSFMAGAGQTGRYILGGIFQYFDKYYTPELKAKALPGPNSTGWRPFYLTARKHPGLYSETLDGRHTFVTSKGIWDEAIVVRLPEPRQYVSRYPGSYENILVEGDIIEISLNMPYTSTSNQFYGAHSVFLKYVGVAGTQWTSQDVPN
jgi:hypothetical protein